MQSFKEKKSVLLQEHEYYIINLNIINIVFSLLPVAWAGCPQKLSRLPKNSINFI